MSRNDDLILAHVRRELELAGAFTMADGVLGKAVLTVMKAVQHYAKEDQNMREAIGDAVNILCRGGLLSEPTNDPDEWLELKGKEGTWSNKRNPFYVSQDGGIHWHHLMSKIDGVSKEVNSGQEEEHTKPDRSSEGGVGGTSDSGAAAVLEKDAGLEVGEQHASVQPARRKAAASKKKPAAKPKARKAA